jgi:hypothetical protein
VGVRAFSDGNVNPDWTTAVNGREVYDVSGIEDAEIHIVTVTVGNILHRLDGRSLERCS